MSVLHIILFSWLSVYQKLANMVKIWWSSDKNKLGIFWAHSIDIWTHSRDIRGQSQKLYDIAQSFGRFLLS